MTGRDWEGAVEAVYSPADAEVLVGTFPMTDQRLLRAILRNTRREPVGEFVRFLRRLDEETQKLVVAYAQVEDAQWLPFLAYASTFEGVDEVLLNCPHLGEEAKENIRSGGVACRRKLVNELVSETSTMILSYDPSAEVREIVAVNPATPPPVLARLAGDPSAAVREAVADNAKVPISVLGRLVADPDRLVRWAVAQNAATPGGMLAVLADDKENTVRESVAVHRNADTVTLERLSRTDSHCAALVAGNPSAPADTLLRLSRSEHMWVRLSVAGNASTPAEALARMAVGADTNVKCFLARNLNTPVGILVKFASDTDEDVRVRVAENPHTPIETLTALTADTNRKVRKTAVKNQRKRAGKK